MTILKNMELPVKIGEGEDIEVSFYYPSKAIVQYLNAIIAKILFHFDIVFLLDTVATILQEIVVNAAKANAKRVYFKKLNLNIADSENYKQGIKNFKEDMVGQLNILEEDLKNSEYRIVFSLKKEKNILNIKVVNNTSILPEELNRINIRKEKAKFYNDFTDAYEEVYDDTEGAGLGIVLTTLLLKNSGIDPDLFIISTDGKNTQASFSIPFQLSSSEILTKVKEHIMSEIRDLPTFPEHIEALQRLCNDPDSSIKDIITKISVDPALTTDVIKLSNSAGFITGKKIEAIDEAVKVIGLKNLYSILLAISSQQILEQKYKKFEQIWDHCKKTAHYAKNIAIKYQLFSIKENSYISGLLHDLGKIILLSIDPTLNNHISKIMKDRDIRSSTIMEEISIGISHSTIGELITKKWNFPDYLIEAIRYHHSPLNANEKYSDLVFVTYLANMFCGIESRKYHYYYIEEVVLERFNLLDEKKFNQLHDELKNSFV